MSIDLYKFKTSQNIVPFELSNKNKYIDDLFNLDNSWTGRLDAQIANTFILESVQLIMNSLVLFEQGYFDCSFYSLRQSFEILTTILFLLDVDKDKRNIDLENWKNKSWFPMYNQMIKFLSKEGIFFSDMKLKMSSYFNELEQIKIKLNKYVHKQGFDTFYIIRNHPRYKDKFDLKKYTQEYEEYLKKSIGAIAVFRLAIDPLPILLMDPEIYYRTGDLMTKPFTEEFVNEYIGIEHIVSYKNTELYTNHYDSIIIEEKKIPCVADVVKNQLIDKTKIDDILKQTHLLYENDFYAVVLSGLSDKIAKIYCIDGLQPYYTNINTIRKKTSWNSWDFKSFGESEEKYNLSYDEAFISCVGIKNDNFFIEHNKKFNKNEIKEIQQVVATLNEMNT